MDELRVLPEEKLEEVRELIRLRGYGRHIHSVESVFIDDAINAGIIKRIADALREDGVV